MLRLREVDSVDPAGVVAGHAVAVHASEVEDLAFSIEGGSTERPDRADLSVARAFNRFYFVGGFSIFHGQDQVVAFRREIADGPSSIIPDFYVMFGRTAVFDIARIVTTLKSDEPSIRSGIARDLIVSRQGAVDG